MEGQELCVSELQQNVQRECRLAAGEYRATAVSLSSPYVHSWYCDTPVVMSSSWE